METDIIELARKHEKQRQWDKAINYYEQYTNNNSNCSDIIYTSYAKCLRMVNQMDRAKKILKKGNSLYPQSKSILLEFYNHYDFLGDWESSKQTALSLINIDSKKSDYYFKLGRSYSALFETKKAEQAYQTGLTCRHGLSFESLIEKIQRGFTSQPNEVKSKYTFFNGKNNLGAIIHEFHGKRYFTKISISTRDAKREEMFYKNIQTKFPVLVDISPNYIDSQTFDKVIYLTIEMINDTKSKETVGDVIKCSKQISTIPYHHIIENYPNPNYLFTFRSRPISIVIFFTKIHKKYYNQKLFEKLKLFSKQGKYHKETEEIIQQLESMIMDNQLYTFIKPEQHYSLLHGDFFPDNMKINKDNGKLQIFDWGTFTTGPHFMDIARYLAAIRTPYSNVKEMYLTDEGHEQRLDLIEKIFFLYAFILCNFVTIYYPNTDLDIVLSNIIEPALADMKFYVSQFKSDEFGFVVKSLLDDHESTLFKKNALKKEIAILKKENNKIQSELQNIVNSKSWKITSPLRNLMESVNKKIK